MPQSETEFDQEIESRLNFEELLVEISAHFINLQADSIDKTIEEAQRRICESLNIDLSALWQWSSDSSDMMTITHLHSPPDGPERPVDIDASKTFPWVLKKMLAGETLAFSSDDLPEEAHIDKASRSHYNIVSSIVIPLAIGGKPILGTLTFDTIGKERSWSEADVRRLKLVAEIFANALLRKQYEERLLESNAKLSLAAESAEAGLWELDYKTGQVWVTDQIYEIFGFKRGGPITIEHYENAILPEDWVTVSKAIENSFTKREKLKVEYRLNDIQSGPKWIHSRGNPYFHHDGSPSRMLGISVDVTERKRMEETIEKQLTELESLKAHVEQENLYLREELLTEQGFENIIGQSKEFSAVLNSANHVAATSATVLLLGETGTGKGLIANLIHQMSERSNRPFVTVNCAALPYNLIESELFGRAKGAFTGADAKQAGRFEVANHGTIFLDEIGEMELEMQTKLLRVLQDGEFERLGSSQTIKVDVRVIAATSRNLKQDVQNGRFREDLYYRLNVFPITIPPLRERTDDIPLLARYFTKKYCRKMRKDIESIPKRTLEQMTSYPWPGNVRELEHLIERSVILSPGKSLSVSHDLFKDELPLPGDGPVKDLASNERDHIIEILGLTNWKIEGRDGAAAILDVHPSTLRFKLNKLGIRRPA